jgi:hypothetical protein
MEADLAQLSHLLTRLNHRSPDSVGTREQKTVAIFDSHTPSSDRDLETGEPLSANVDETLTRQ